MSSEISPGLRAEEAFYRAEIEDEGREIVQFPDRERAELAVVTALV